MAEPTYTVQATFTVQITNPAAVSMISGTSGDERSKVQSAANAGLNELKGIAGRYGFSISEATVTVTE